MTGAVATDEIRTMSPAPQRVRLSYLCNRTQVDAALPLDVPIASLVPQLVTLAETHDAGNTRRSDDLSITEANSNIWVLSRHDGKTPLMPERTLRETGVAEGELLWLTAERALSAPTLYDDAVDAAARLNKAVYASWDATAALWMAFVGLYLVSGTWVYFLVANAFAANRGTLVGLSVALVLTQVGSAALAYRRYERRDIAAALGWAVLPISAAIAWVALHGLGRYGLAVGCGAMVVMSSVLFRCVGTGHWGYLTVQVISSLAGIALVVHTAGIRADVVGALVAVVASLGCLGVPRLTVRFARSEPLLRDPERSRASSADLSASGIADLKQSGTVPPPGAERVWTRVQSVTTTRSALYTGLAVSVGCGALVVVTSSRTVPWSGLVFAWACAAALGLRARRAATTVERAGLAIPATALTALSCWLGQGGRQPIPIVAFCALLTTSMAFAVFRASARAGRRSKRLTTLLAHLDYLNIAALIPLMVWATDAYGLRGFL